MYWKHLLKVNTKEASVKDLKASNALKNLSFFWKLQNKIVNDDNNNHNLDDDRFSARYLIFACIWAYVHTTIPLLVIHDTTHAATAEVGRTGRFLRAPSLSTVTHLKPKTVASSGTASPWHEPWTSRSQTITSTSSRKQKVKGDTVSLSRCHMRLTKTPWTGSGPREAD